MNGLECAFCGRLGRNPELRMVKGGELALLTLNVAVEDGGADDTSPEWVRVAVFGEKAEELAGRLRKGTRVYAEGKLRLERWEGRDGQPRAGLAVKATVLQPLGQIGRRRLRGSRPADGARVPVQAAQGRAQASGGTRPHAPAQRRPPQRPGAARRPETVGDGGEAPFDDPMPF